MRAPITIALGPEGGMEPVERESLIAGGFAPVRLATGTLRFETAGIAAIAIAVAGLSLSGNKNGQA
jgi:16S rRNA (uracil1498-N3)-methyltransferase